MTDMALVHYIIHANTSDLEIRSIVDFLNNISDYVEEIQDQNVRILPKERTYKTEEEVLLPNSAVILPYCYMEGPVAIYPKCKIGPYAYLRPGTIIGPEANVGHATEVKASIIGARIWLSHRAYVGNSCIGRDCMIGVGFSSSVRKYLDEPIKVRDLFTKEILLETDMVKLGVIIQEEVWISSHILTMPGTFIKANSVLGPFNSYGGSKGKIIA